MGTGKLKDIKDFENMKITVHRVNADKVLKKEVNTNLLNLISQVLEAWVKDQDQEVKRLEELAIEEIQKLHPDMDYAHALMWMTTTLGIFQKKTWVQKPDPSTMTHAQCYAELQDDLIPESECNSVDFEVVYGRMSLAKIREEVRKRRN